ncbi:MAG: deoxyhypusine synthase [Acidobacteriota bacterium]|jgi:deoxyhypusine synthase|nr:deoxyhypusine synthase [Acidobacteriota bacterium]NLT31929.1 deoxyhypusine synthase [Acidobacteriota bacterium]
MGEVKLPRNFVSKYPHKFSKGKQQFLRGRRILPAPITGKEPLPDLIDGVFLAYNGGRLQEACRLFTEKMTRPKVTVGMSLAGALTPAGLGAAVVVPLIKAGFVDWIVATGANLYHDMHYAMNLPLYRGSPFSPDQELRRMGVVRIYDILLDYNDVLMATDHVLRQMLMQPEFQKEMGTTELHYLLGKYCAEFEEQTGRKDSSLLAAAYRAGVPCFCPSPGDSTIGMNVAGLELRKNALRINPSRDVNESTGIVLAAKRAGHKTGTLLIGGGSPKNFTLQTEPQIQEILRVKEEGHDYFIQFTDARPDTGGLSGATPQEAVTWGKVDPSQLPDAVVCYVDSTVAFPLLAHYALARSKPRKLKRLYDRLPEIMELVSEEYWKHNKTL